MLDNAKWIWIDRKIYPNQIAVFRKSFVTSGGNVTLTICAESDYVAEVNGKVVDFSQFPGYPHEKYYDVLDLTPYCKAGENELLLTVRYEGLDTLCRLDDGAGVIFSIQEAGVELAVSDEATEGALHTGYVQNVTRLITTQLGYTVSMKPEEPMDYRPCVLAPRTCTLLPRPVQKCELFPAVLGKRVKLDGREIYDFGMESAGYLRLTVRCPSPCTVTASYGEHLADGCVRQKIGIRDFSLDFVCREGENTFVQYFVRLGLRYLELRSDGAFETVAAELIPAWYPQIERPVPSLSSTDARIYEMSVRTLRLCMNFHYEDCPWREQALYVVDGRNQMLCGYYAFENAEFQRANLIMMTKGIREDGLMELTFPARNTPAIPFFSIMYPVNVWEYVKHTGDRSIIPEVMDTMLGIVRGLLKYQGENGLISYLPYPYWNFYEWSAGSIREEDFCPENKRPEQYDLILNCVFVYALTRLKELCEMGGEILNVDLEAIKAAIVKEFFRHESGKFCLSTLQRNEYSELGNAFALLIGLGDERTLAHLRSGTMIPVTLSMSCFVYDALLQADEEKYAEYVLRDLRKRYSYMISQGATSCWETMNGPNAENKAWSLCHGWSAMPIYYFHRLKKYL